MTTKMAEQDQAVELRPLRATDEAEWRRLWTLYLEFYESSVPEEVYEATFKRLLSDDTTTFRALVADKGDGLLGLVHYVFHPHCWRVEQVCYLQDLFVDKAARGTGLGRALIEAVYAAADREGAPHVYWLTQEFNTTARQLYDRIGKVTPFIKYNRF